MERFDPNKLEQYIDSKDFFKAADYLSGFRNQITDGKRLAELNRKIDSYTLEGEKQRAIVGGLDNSSQEAFNFITAIDGNGIIPRTNNPDNIDGTKNEWGDKYFSYIDNLRANEVYSPGGRNVKGERIDRIRVDLYNNNIYEEYLNSLNENENDIKQSGVNVTKDSKNGHIYLDIPTKNANLVNYLNNANALSNTSTRSYVIPTYGAAMYYGDINNFEIKGITSSNIIVNTKQFNYNNISELQRLVNNARKIKNNAISSVESDDLEDMVVLPYLGQGDANLYKDLQENKISIDDYNKYHKINNEQYTKILQLQDLSKLNVYVAGEGVESLDLDVNEEAYGDTPILSKAKAKDMEAVKTAILTANAEDRITYGAGIRNGVSGTYIEITSALDKDKNEVNGKYGKHLVIFVEGLFKSEAEKSFNQNTKQMAVKDNADMKRWNYSRTLKDGSRVGYDKQMGAYMQQIDDFGQSVRVPIREDEMLWMLNKDHIITENANKILSLIGKGGTPLNYLNNGRLVPYNIENITLRHAAIATNELYPQGEYSDEERIYQQSELYRQIMEQLNIIYRPTINNNSNNQ